ncbi:MAG: dTDP-4-dehydrorhamnose reductase [Bacteroidia bacterium]|nr:dTDP-4-dehydrorhamnose reductase [Bacteroidia bacterium]
MNNILVTGANGQLGSELRELTPNYPDYTFFFTDVSDLDITNSKALQSFVENNKIDTIFNCAAYTEVDAAEDNDELADTLNHKAVKEIAKICKEIDIKLIHISTDYVFNGKHFKPYLESDVTKPINVYGKTKLAGEFAILEVAPKNSVIIRTSWLYSSFGNNFVRTMLKLSRTHSEVNVIDDQIGSPTYAKHLAEVMIKLISEIKNGAPEILHFANEGVCSWFDFAKAIFEYQNLEVKTNAIESKDYPVKAKRPYYSVLNKSKIKDKYQITIPHWKDALKDCLNEL